MTSSCRWLLPALTWGLVAAAGSLAQEAEPLASDRPDFTETAASVPRGSVQVEGGATWTDEEGGEELTVGELLVRIGLGRGLELRLAPGGYTRAEPDAGPSVDGREDGFVGFKIELAPERGNRPEMAVLVGSSVPTGSRALRSDGWQPEAVLALAWTLKPRWSLASNLGAASLLAEDERFESAFGSLALGFEAGERLGLFFEVYALSREEPGGDAAVFVDTGLTWAVGPDLQLDARVGSRVFDGEARPFLGVGLVARW
jgi:Putative MetA-pathway of phenol degradation